jgi:acyl-coenzyme A thioesterase 9
MHDSYSEVTLPFSSNPALWQDYINPSGGLRTGKLMEHLDALAGSISYRHVLGSPSDSEARMDTSPEKNGLYIVTAACDRLDMLDVPLPGRDVRMSGMVIAVGRSSMEVVVRMENLGGEGEQDRTLLLGALTFFCSYYD